ncbi:MAG: dTDP-4-dehydrorhamnose 3,5-epimerase family protein [Bacteroidota bacterium]
MFTFHETPLSGCYRVKPKAFLDHRGKFIKLFHEPFFEESGFNGRFQESYYSVSGQRVLRGLHFQTPPHAHIKLVGCISGRILDVVADLRINSKTYKKVFATELSSENAEMMYVPEGFAHGFYTLSEEAVFLSFNSKKYAAESDAGIRWNSIDFTWPDHDPVVSEKDMNLPGIDEYNSPF